MMESLALAEGHFQMQHIAHVNAVRFRQQETLGDILVLDFVIIGATVEFGEGGVELEGVLATGDEHGQLSQ